MQAALMMAFAVTSFNVCAQNNPVADKPATLNLDDQKIAKELIKESRDNDSGNNSSEKISVEPNQLDASFAKAEKHGLKPEIVEINTAGSPQRVTKVTGADGTYCVYAPTVARTDGIDAIQNGLQNQVRTCPP